MSNGILADLLITAPLIYFLAIRKTSVSKLTLLRVFMAGILFADIILRSHSSPVLQIIKTWISPVVEGVLIFLIGKKFYHANRHAKAKNGSVDFLLYCRSLMAQVFGAGKAANIISTEMAVIYYALFGIKARSIDYRTRFTSYKENGLPILWGVILIIFLIDTTGVYFLLSLFSKTVAWVLTAISFYTCIQLFVHIRALKARPSIIHADSIEVHHGLAGDAFIQLNNIEKIEISNKKPVGREAIKFSLLKGLENHNMVVYLKEPIEVTKIFGITKQADPILFFIDRPKEFFNIVTAPLANNAC